MKKQSNLLLLAISLVVLLSQCKKTIPELSGTASVADFSFAQVPPGDSLPFPVSVQFTNKSVEEFLYQWDFGDNTALSPFKSPLHTYKIGGTYDVRLTSVGTNGNNTITKKVFAVSACQNDFFNKLTTCSSAEWIWSTDADAIKILAPNGTQVYIKNAPVACQADDIFKFSADGVFSYDAVGKTFDAQSANTCQAAKANATTFKVAIKTGQNPKIVLGPTSNGVGRPFIGTTDLVKNNAYEVMSYTADNMVLRAVYDNISGVMVEIKLRRKVPLTIADLKALLTGTAGKGWKLDGTPGANTIIVGIESNPGVYFGGGPLADCQMDDVYTFYPTNKMSYNANGSTFNGGNISPNYNCGDDRSYSNTSFTFGTPTGGVEGLAAIQITGGGLPSQFIGTTDVPDNVYRIIEITPTRMVLRAGNGSGTVFQFKMIAQ